MIQQQSHLGFDPLLPLSGNLLLAVFILASLFLTWRSNIHFQEKRLRLSVFVLRVLAMLLLFLVFQRPFLEKTNAKEIPGTIAVLIDTSASMSLLSGDHARSERVQEGLRAMAAAFEKWRGKHTLEFYTFNESLQPSSMDAILSKTLRFDGGMTDLGGALMALRDRAMLEKKALSAVLLFSDGVDRGLWKTERGSEEQRSAQMEKYPAPIFTFQPGPADFKDLRLSDTVLSEFAFVKTPLEIEVDVELEGYPARDIPVTLSQGEQLISSQTAVFSGGGDQPLRTRVKFVYTPQKLGYQVLTVNVPKLSDEATTENNRKSFLLRVIRDKVRVLHVAGHPSWDEKFLRLALKRDPNIDLIAFYILRTRDDVIYDVEQSELSLIPFPHQELFGPELKTFDLVIFQDFDYRDFFPVSYLENLHRYVEGGGSFMMVGGQGSFAEANYGETPLGKILPASLSVPPDPKDGGLQYAVTLTDAGKRHPVSHLQADSIVNEKTWRALPPLKGLNAMGGLLPGGVVLVEASGGERRQRPVLAVREVGKGKTMALATDSSWRWNFLRVRDGGTPEAYWMFYKNAIRWLIGDPTESLVEVEVRNRESSGVVAEVRARDRTYRPNTKATVKVQSRNEEGNEPAIEKSGKTDGAGFFEGEFDLTKKGFYRFTAEVDLPDGGKSVGETVFSFQTDAGEWDSPQINEAFLKILSEKTGGKHFILPKVSDFQISPKFDYQVIDRKTIPLWDRIWMLLPITALLCLEWWIRRRHGLA